jgi:hypothetical protein
MAVSIDYGNSNVIDIPLVDWTLVSGTFYTFDTEVFRLALKVLEASETGMVFPDTHIRNAPVTVAGVTLAQSIQIIAPYTNEFQSGAYTVQLEGSNNNIWSVQDNVLVQNQTQIIPTNSAGLVVTNGLPVIQSIVDGVWDEVLTGATHNINNSAGKKLRQTADKLSYSGTVNDTGATTTVVKIDSGASSVDDFYKDQTFIFTDGVLDGQARIVSSYVGSTREITFNEPLSSAPVNGVGIQVLSDHIHSTDQIANAVWDKDISGYTVDGQAGLELQVARLQAALAAALSA